MSGRVEARRLEARRARCVHVENAERHGKSAPAIDHRDEIGVLRIVVAQPIAVIAVAADEQGRERPRTVFHGRRHLRFGARMVGDLGQMRLIGAKRPAAMVQRRQHQCRVGDIERFLARLADLAQALGRSFFGAHRGRHCPNPSLSAMRQGYA